MLAPIETRQAMSRRHVRVVMADPPAIPNDCFDEALRSSSNSL
jgi:hypothetical protein